MPVRGATQTLTVTFRSSPGGPVADVTDLTLTFLLDGDEVLGPLGIPPVAHDALGRYRYEWEIPSDADPGTYTAVWSGLLEDALAPSIGYETIEVTAAVPPADPYVEVPPFGATVQGAADLVPEARLLPSPPADGEFGIPVSTVAAWVEELTGVVAMTLTGWQRLNDEPVAPETTSDRDQLVEAARTVIHNGAASYLEAARHPERSSANADTYSQVLWERYSTGLDRLAAWLTGRLDSAEPGDTPDVDSGAASAFPAPIFADSFPA